jgi:hypothetical protein
MMRARRKTFNSDVVAWKLAMHLVEDFTPFLSQTEKTSLMFCCMRKDIRMWRELVSLLADKQEEDSVRFKARYQLADLFKEYTFETDVYTPHEVESLSIKKFLDNQERINQLSFDALPNVTRQVVGWARGFISRVLGDYNHEELLLECDWAKKSSVGIPMRKASRAERYQVPLTGSPSHIAWYQFDYLNWDPSPKSYLEKQVECLNDIYRQCEVLNAVLVLKTFKSRRMIMANTTLGSFYTTGVGRVITKRLRRAGFDIRFLQERHRMLAREGSITGNTVTADQSLASDNITVELTKLLTEARWYHVLMKGRIGKIQLGTDIIETKTLSTMGIGFTFPFQTLLFLSLLEGIKRHFKLKGSYSVFGDDLIYPIKFHRHVVEIFPTLGLVINEDKTFSSGFFRESCGGDYHRGLDVRPFHFGMEGARNMSFRKFEAFLYSSINGLRCRWKEEEIPETLRCLGQQLALQQVKACVVPPDFPDTSGVRRFTFIDQPNWLLDARVPKMDIHGTVSFDYLRFISEGRIENRHEPYLWKALRRSGDFIQVNRGRECIAIRYRDDILPDIFVDKEAETQPANYRSKLTGRRLRKKDTLILTNKGRYRVQRGSSFRWTHEPQQGDLLPVEVYEVDFIS